jgi:hypothetical protein
LDHLAEAQNAELTRVALASIAMTVIAEKLRMIFPIGRFQFVMHDVALSPD